MKAESFENSGVINLLPFSASLNSTGV